jgi:hypothetical protein
MKTLDQLKNKEMFIAACVSKALSVAQFTEMVIKAKCKDMVNSLRIEVARQARIREDRLVYLALEEAKVRREIKELENAFEKHTNNLISM